MKPAISKIQLLERIKGSPGGMEQLYLGLVAELCPAKSPEWRRGRCPFVPHPRLALNVNIEHGGWRCHACSRTGDVFSIWAHIRGLPRTRAGFYAVLSDLAEFLDNPSGQAKLIVAADVEVSSSSAIAANQPLAEVAEPTRSSSEDRRDEPALSLFHTEILAEMSRVGQGWNSLMFRFGLVRADALREAVVELERAGLLTRYDERGEPHWRRGPEEQK